MDILAMFYKISLWEESLASAAIEGNRVANKHLNVLDDIDDLEEKYMYLKFVFNELGNRTKSTANYPKG